MFALIHYVYFQLPVALPAEQVPLSEFSGKRAYTHAEKMVNNIGERMYKHVGKYFKDGVAAKPMKLTLSILFWTKSTKSRYCANILHNF